MLQFSRPSTVGMVCHYYNDIYVVRGLGKERFVCHLSQDGTTLTCRAWFGDSPQSHIQYNTFLTDLNQRWNTIRLSLVFHAYQLSFKRVCCCHETFEFEKLG